MTFILAFLATGIAWQHGFRAPGGGGVRVTFA